MGFERDGSGFEFGAGPAGDGGELARLDAERAITGGGDEQGVKEIPLGDFRFTEKERIDGEYALASGEERFGAGSEGFATGVGDEERGAARGATGEGDDGDGPRGADVEFPIRGGGGVEGDHRGGGGGNGGRLVVDDGGERCTRGGAGARERPAGRDGELVEVEVDEWQWDFELGGGFQFGLRGDFLGVERGVAGEKRGADHAVEGLAVIDFKIVGAGIGVAMRAQALGLAVEFENRLGGGEERGQRVVGGEAAVVLGVVGEEGVAAGEEGGEVRVVGDGGEVVGGLLGVAKVGGKFGARTVTGVTGDGIGEGDTRIQRTDHDGLPTAAGESAHGDARGVGVGQGEKRVEAPRHREVERREAAHAAEVELVHAIVGEAVAAKLALGEPLDVERGDTPFGEIDAPELFVGGGLAVLVVAVDGEVDGDFPGDVVWQIKQGGNPQARQCLVAEFFNRITGAAGKGVEPHDRGLGVAPRARSVAAENDFIEDVAARAVGEGLPVGEGGYSGHRGDAACGVGADLGERESGIDDGVGEQCGDAGGCGTLRGGEREGPRRKDQGPRKQPGETSEGGHGEQREENDLRRMRAGNLNRYFVGRALRVAMR